MRSRVAKTILGSSLVLAFVATFVFNWNQLGVQFTLTTLLAIAVLGYVQMLSKKKIDAYVIGLLLATAVLSVFVMIRDSAELAAANIGLILLTFSVVIHEIINLKRLQLIDYLFSSWLLPILGVVAIPEVFKNINLKVNRRLTKNQAQIARGLVIALPLLIIFGLLFSAADAVFANIFKTLFDFEINLPNQIVLRTFSFVALFILSAGALAYAFLFKHKPIPEKTDEPTSNHSIELMIVLGSLNALFLLFIAIQAVYLFGGREVVLDGDLTYAEYGRRGFFELVTVSSLVFMVSFVVKKFLSGVRSQVPTILQLALIAQVVVIMVSAIKRLSLYEEVFGFTVLRFYSHSFIFLLAAAFGLLIFSILAKQREEHLLRGLFMSLLGYVIVLNILSPDAFIARQNRERFIETGKVDTLYSQLLSNDALEEEVQLFELVQESSNVEETDPRILECDLVERRNRLMREQAHWSTWHIGRSHAENLLLKQNISCDSDGFDMPYIPR